MKYALALLVAAISFSATAGEKYTVKDELGFRIGSIEKDVTGNYVARDKLGFRKFRIERSVTGKLEVRDLNGFLVDDLKDIEDITNLFDPEPDE